MFANRSARSTATDLRSSVTPAQARLAPPTSPQPAEGRYKALLANVDAGGPDLADDNLDDGGPTIAGKYKGTDEAYAKLLGKLADRQFADCVDPTRHRWFDIRRSSRGGPLVSQIL